MNKKPMFLAFRTVVLVLASILLSVGKADGGEIRVMTSGGFTAPYIEVIPEYERATQNKVVTSYGASMGGAPDSIPMRMQRGEPVDVVIMASTALDEQIQQGKVVPGSRIDLMRSSIGMAVRRGTPKPDLSTMDALQRTLLQAKTIAYSAPRPELAGDLEEGVPVPANNSNGLR